ncbi:hypothetical protein HD806DRAFT_537313 [Xylariaceae sp. AK1471]|nr:hypothetical protein HD806DRAFT_537313 [Xylariaceae sp. AK1471]
MAEPNNMAKPEPLIKNETSATPSLLSSIPICPDGEMINSESMNQPPPLTHSFPALDPISFTKEKSNELNFYVQGMRRSLNDFTSIGSAVALLMSYDSEKYTLRSQDLPTRDQGPTVERAELTAIILALKWALNELDSGNKENTICVRIYSASRFVNDCMNKRCHIWSRNGWLTCRGTVIAYKDLLTEALALEGILRRKVCVDYTFRASGRSTDVAYVKCAQALDKQETKVRLQLQTGLKRKRS